MLLLLLSRGRITRGRCWFCVCSGTGVTTGSVFVDSNLPKSSVGNSTFSEGRSSIGIKSSSALSDKILLSSSITAGALGLIMGFEIGFVSIFFTSTFLPLPFSLQPFFQFRLLQLELLALLWVCFLRHFCEDDLLSFWGCYCFFCGRNNFCFYWLSFFRLCFSCRNGNGCFSFGYLTIFSSGEYFIFFLHCYP